MQHSPEQARKVLQRTVEQIEAAAKTARADGFPIKARTLDTLAESYRKKLLSATADEDARRQAKFSPSETPNGF